jgi:hypothetical protein
MKNIFFKRADAIDNNDDDDDDAAEVWFTNPYAYNYANKL